MLIVLHPGSYKLDDLRHAKFTGSGVYFVVLVGIPKKTSVGPKQYGV